VLTQAGAKLLTTDFGLACKVGEIVHKGDYAAMEYEGQFRIGIDYIVYAMTH